MFFLLNHACPASVLSVHHTISNGIGGSVCYFGKNKALKLFMIAKLYGG